MMKIVQEIDFWDDQKPKRLILFRSNPFLKEIDFCADEKTPTKNHCLEEEDDQILFLDQINNSKTRVCSCSSSSSSWKRDRSSITTVDQETDQHDQMNKKRKISSFRLFGADIITGISDVVNDDYDNYDDDWERRRKAKGKEKVVEELELEKVDDDSRNIFNPMLFEEDGCNNSQALVIYKPRATNKEIKKKSQPIPRKSKKKLSTKEQEPPAPLPPSMQRRIHDRGGSDPIFLFQKDLTCSDVNPGLNRVFINRSEKLVEALTEEERIMVNNEDYYSGLRVFTMDQHAEDRDYEMELTKWNVGSYMIVLKKEWMKFVRANNLLEGDRVEGWGFRVQGVFYLGLNAIIRN